jgi:hypothetical protein
MELGAIQATAGGCLLLLLTAVVWLASRLKRKNQQLRRALVELQRRSKESQMAPKPEPIPPEPIPMVGPEPPAVIRAIKLEPVALADAFLWEHLGDKFLWKHLSKDEPDNDKLAVAEVSPGDSPAVPKGMCDRAEVQPFLEKDSRFTGLVVLVGLTNSRATRQEHPAQPFVAGLLRETDFACRNSDDEFLIVCPGVRGADAQRRLNEISERLWNFQLRGKGSFSVLFSWGGIGVENEPLSEAIASATERMQQTKRSRLLFFTRKAG